MQPMANMALRAGRDAALAIVRAFDRPDLIKVSEKGAHDFVTNVDRQAESIVFDALQKTYPDHVFIGEESGGGLITGDDAPEYQWVVDPIDGTTNFVRGVPHFCVSIACIHRGRLEHGVIVDPIRNEEFVASRGKGCSANGRRCRVSDRTEIDGALIAMGGTRLGSVATGHGELVGKLLDRDVRPRETGSACLDLAWLAAGRFDGLWYAGLNLWDMAAGVLMITEAGGRVSDFAGGQGFLDSGNVVAGAPRIFRSLLPDVRKHLG